MSSFFCYLSIYMLPRMTPRPIMQTYMKRETRGGAVMMRRRRAPLITELLFFCSVPFCSWLICRQMPAYASLVMIIK